MRKSDVTGSISTAKGEEMLKAQNFSALDNLRGKAAGVNIFSNSSQPGAYGSRVVIRGQATINASSDPLYVVDGVVMENFYLMNPNDIESMEVLKDASATAIYGARGANGVIMVTTKRGNKEGGTKVSYSGSVSLAHRARKMDTMRRSGAMLLCKVLRMRIDGDLIRMAIHLTGLLIVRIGLQIVVSSILTVILFMIQIGKMRQLVQRSLITIN